MAFTSCTVTVNNIASLSDLPNTTDGLTSTQLKQKFDQAATDLKTYLNSTLLTELARTTSGSSASENIGGRSIAAKSVIAGISAGTLYSQLNSLHTQLNSFVSGTGFIPTTGGTFTGVVEFISGSESAPGITNSDLDTGIFFPTNNTIAISTNGSERIRIDSSGRLLSNNSTSITPYTGSGVPRIQLNGTSGQSSIGLNTFESTASTGGRIYFNRSKSNTIGTQTQVTAGDELGSIQFNGSSGDATTGFLQGAIIRASVDGTITTTSEMPSRLTFWTTPDNFSTPIERVRISNDGTVSFNSYTTAGFLKNDVNGVISTNTAVTGTGNLVFGTSPTISGATLSGQVSFDTAGTASAPAVTFSTDLDTGMFRGAANQLAFSTNATEALRINSVQRVLVNNTAQFTTYRGATSNIPQFQVAGTTKDTSGILSSIFSADATGSRIFFAKSRNATVGSFTIVNNGDSLGEISFGGSHDTQMYEAARINVEADGAPSNAASMPGRIIFSTTASGSTTVTERLRISATGALTSAQTYAQLVGGTNRAMYVDSTGLIGNLTSSIRFKQDVEDFYVDSEKVLQLEPKTYYYKTDVEQNGENATKQIGFIAEQAQELGLEYLYQKDEQGIPNYFAYEKLPTYLLGVIKNQQQLIESLQTRIEQLESKVN